MRAALPALGLALLVLGAGAAWTALSIADYLNTPLPLDSFSGYTVFTVDGELVQYPAWTPGASVFVVNAGLLAVVAALLGCAAVWRPRRGRGAR